MDKKPTILDILAKIFTIFGITVLILTLMCAVFGDEAKGYSEMFSLGSDGLSVSTLLEFLLSSAVLTGLSTLFMTDTIIRSMPLALRIVLMFASGFTSVVLFVILFGWFPMDDPKAWLGFIISCSVCCPAGAMFSIMKNRAENRQLAEALKKLKEENNG